MLPIRKKLLMYGRLEKRNSLYKVPAAGTGQTDDCRQVTAIHWALDAPDGLSAGHSPAIRIPGKVTEEQLLTDDEIFPRKNGNTRQAKPHRHKPSEENPESAPENIKNPGNGRESRPLVVRLNNQTGHMQVDLHHEDEQAHKYEDVDDD
ncbi:MAG TPA: hypothetical protein ENK96_10580, partial [Desulfobulbaceae bacterium]|nr:hypothetical protein [Desulfobulbaceae bacterium]